MATKKVTKKSAPKKTAVKKTAKKATKPAATKKTKKATAIAKVKAFKHKRVALEPIGTETLPDMVLVVSGPSWASSIIGKRYVSTERAMAIIEALDAEKTIAKGAKAVTKELLAAGVTPMDNSEIETETE
jgi:hypothetical protein